MNVSMLRAVGFAGLLGFAGLAMPAAAAVTITGAVTGVTAGQTDPGLIINANPVAFPSFTLENAGDFRDVTVLTVGTPESSVDLDDFLPRPLSVAFTFTQPGGTSGAPITGTTVGFYQLLSNCGVLAGGCGSATFGAPSVFNFSNGGQFSVRLSNVTFGTPGTANVTGRFTLVTAPVPEPSTWALMLLGFGAIGATMRSPARRQRATVSYA